MDIESKIKNAAARNAELLNTLHETDYAEPTLVQHNNYIEQVQKDLKASGNHGRDLHNQREESQKKHESYRDSHVKRFLFKASGNKDKFAQRTQDGEREYFQTLQDIQQQERMQKSLYDQLNNALTSRSMLEAAATKHKNAQAELDTLYSSIFSGPTPQFPQEDDRENACIAAGVAYRQIKTAEAAEKLATQHLQGAAKNMMAAHSCLQSAAGFSRMDMFGGGTMTDMMERNRLSDAEMSMNRVRSLLDRAQQASAQVGSFPDVHIHHGSIMTDVFFDNIWTDYQFHQQIQRAIAEWSQLNAAIQRELDAAQRRFQGAQNEARMREEQLEMARKELQRTREHLFETVGGTEGASFNPQHSPATTQNRDEAASTTQTRSHVVSDEVPPPETPPPAYTAEAENEEWWK